MKNTKIKIKCVGGGGNLLYLLCLISNTMSQLEQSSLQPSTDLQHRHLLHTTSYNHLLLLHLLISRKGKRKQQQARIPPSRGVEKPEGPSAVQPTTENRIRINFSDFIDIVQSGASILKSADISITNSYYQNLLHGSD